MYTAILFPSNIVLLVMKPECFDRFSLRKKTALQEEQTPYCSYNILCLSCCNVAIASLFKLPYRNHRVILNSQQHAEYKAAYQPLCTQLTRRHKIS